MHAKATYKVAESVPKCAVGSGTARKITDLLPCSDWYPLALLARFTRSGPSPALYHYTAHRWKLGLAASTLDATRQSVGHTEPPDGLWDQRGNYLPLLCPCQ